MPFLKRIDFRSIRLWPSIQSYCARHIFLYLVALPCDIGLEQLVLEPLDFLDLARKPDLALLDFLHDGDFIAIEKVLWRELLREFLELDVFFVFSQYKTLRL